MDDSKILSYARGLIVPPHEALKLFEPCCKAETPTLHEMNLANRPHRWPEMRRLQRDFFNAFADKVTEYEVDMLRTLGLPEIETVRTEAKKAPDVFEYTTAMGKELDAIFAEWEADLIGENGVYPYHQLSAFSIGLDRNQKRILEALPEELTGAAIAQQVIPSLENTYLRAIIADGTKRIKTRLAQSYLAELKLALKYMARKGANPLEVARMIHGMACEGQLWYWLRLARSESVLALNAAYDAESNAQGIRYDEWSAAPTACPICSAFDGRVWERGTGPQPVSDSHPHCLCLRVPLYNTDKPVQSRWNRETPYDRPYGRDELSLLNQLLDDQL